MAPVLEALAEHVLVFDGAMGSQLQNADLSPADFVLPGDPRWPDVAAARDRLGDRPLEGCNELLCLTRPEIVRGIHAAYLDAGADLVETNSFGTTSIVLAEFDVPELVRTLALASARLAREAADAASTPARPRFVAGAIGPGTKLASLGQTPFETLRDTYRDAFVGLIEGGSDVLLLETLQDLLMVKAALVGIQGAFADTGKRLPVFVQVTMEQTGTMLLGSEMGAALCMLECFPDVRVVGMNCATGPADMLPHVRFLGRESTRPISVQPNAGLPVMKGGRAVYELTPEELARWQDRFVSEHGVALAGGCCGTTPAHIRAVAEAVGGRPHGNVAHWQRVRGLYPGFDFRPTPENAEGVRLVGAASLYAFQPYRQDNSFLIVGEKTNANGSKAFRTMLAAENWDGLTELAREQEAEGAHVLDVCAAYVGRDEERDMRTLLGRYNQALTVPMMVDSTELPVIEASLRCIAGKPIVNSINFEDGETRARRVLELVRTYGAGVVALTIDETGMAKTVEHKIQVADRLIALTREHGIPDHDVFVDCLTFTLGSGDEEFRASAIATLDAIEALHARYPRVQSVLGVSNVSFGLRPAARQILNSVMLARARERGLTSAIVHAAKIRPENRVEPEVWRIADDLVFDRRRFEAFAA